VFGAVRDIGKSTLAELEHAVAALEPLTQLDGD
jgi:hypothetical protein